MGVCGKSIWYDMIPNLQHGDKTKNYWFWKNIMIGLYPTAALKRHLLYFLDTLVGLAFFDPRVDDGTKIRMVKNKNLQKLPRNPRKVAAIAKNLHQEDFGTERTCGYSMPWRLTGLTKRGLVWRMTRQLSLGDQLIFQRTERRCGIIFVVNDAEKRAIALMKNTTRR